MTDFKAVIPDKVKELLGDEQVRMYLVLGVTLALVVLYSVFAIIPGFFDLSRASREVARLNKKIDFVVTHVKRLDEMTERLKALKMELEDYSRGLPEQKEIPEFLEGLSSIARTSSVKILSITPSALKTVAEGKKSGGYYREMPIVITAKSGYHELGHFISNLETGERFITIENLRIQHDSRFPRRHSVRIVLKTYVSVEDERK
ncbi:MAG: hypothetical protein DRP85_01175 [Candidatus Makaraimicrobium thalassicum]|nr:MAG: hypothetical protein DRP85_01175 [Candidatus Omnitrophota bacterium]